MAEEDDILDISTLGDDEDDRIYYEGGPIVLGGMECYFYKNRPDDRIWWIESPSVGDDMFSFDMKSIYHMWSDYPWKLTPEQKSIFDEENPYWADFFKSRNANDR